MTDPVSEDSIFSNLGFLSGFYASPNNDEPFRYDTSPSNEFSEVFENFICDCNDSAFTPMTQALKVKVPVQSNAITMRSTIPRDAKAKANTTIKEWNGIKADVAPPPSENVTLPLVALPSYSSIMKNEKNAKPKQGATLHSKPSRTATSKQTGPKTNTNSNDLPFIWVQKKIRIRNRFYNIVKKFRIVKKYI
jgi:hypothetical protein